MSSKPLAARSLPLEKTQFCRTCGKYATGITVATVRDQTGAAHGMTANSFSSVSVDPPLILFCVDHRAKILEHFRKCEFFGVNVLRNDQQELSHHFARGGYDRFDGVEWKPGETGVPLLPHVLATLECGLHGSVEAGDHTILIGEVLHAHYHEGEPLIFFSSKYRRLEPRDDIH